MADAGGGWDLERLRSARIVILSSLIPPEVTVRTPPRRDHPPGGMTVCWSRVSAGFGGAWDYARHDAFPAPRSCSTGLHGPFLRPWHRGAGARPSGDRPRDLPARRRLGAPLRVRPRAHGRGDLQEPQPVFLPRLL